MRRNLLILLIIVFSNVNGQNDITFDTLFLETKDETQILCDSIIDIFSYGNLDYKLIFKQIDFDITNKHLIGIPHSKISKTDKSIILSDEKGLSKTILKLEYDTCLVSNFSRRYNKLEFIEFVTPPDTAKIRDWKIEINYQGSRCMDTDYHSARISKNDSNFIDFSCLHNIQLFEMDLNKDSFFEIYLISYIWCESEIRIYRISN